MFQLFQFVDGLLPFSGVASICFWAGVSGVISMLLYRRFSPQVRLEELMQELNSAQKELNNYDGEFDGMLPLLKRTLGLSLKRVWLSFGPSIVAAVPLIVIMFCVGYGLDQRPQSDDSTSVTQSVVEDAASDEYAAIVKPKVVGGEFNNHATDYTGFGPSWMRSWIFVFIVVSSCSALAVRQFGGII